METTDIQARILETKVLVRRVRTPEGARRFGQPIGSIIVRDPIPSFTRRRKRRKTPRSAGQTPDASMVPNAPHERSVDVRAASVAPSPEVPGVSEGDAIPKSSNRSVSFASRVQLYTNEAPMRDQLDHNYLATATAKQAAQDLIELGANLRISREFLSDRDFMVSLAETVRIHEEMFPGFVYRHGNFYAGRKNMGGGKSGVIAYNKTIARYDAEDDTIDTMTPGDHAYGTTSGHDLSGNVRTGVASEEVSLNPGTEMSQSITVFLAPVIDSAHRSMSTGHAAKGGDLGFFAANDWWTDMSEKFGNRQAAMIYLMTHEFGHAINNTVSGNMSFEIDGWEDPDQYKRRWYAEYYNNAQMDLFEDMGVFKRTGKKYEGDHLKEEADYYKNVVLRNEDYVQAYREYRDDMLEAMMEEDGTGTGREFHEVFAELMEKYDFPEDVVEYLRMANTKPSAREVIWILRASAPLTPKKNDAFAMVTKNRYASSQGATVMELLRGGASKPTFDVWEEQGYITDFDLDAWRNLVSGYASKKVVEFEAESWASYMLDRQTTEATQRWGNMVHDMYSWWVQDDMDPEFGQNNDEE